MEFVASCWLLTSSPDFNEEGNNKNDETLLIFFFDKINLSFDSVFWHSYATPQYNESHKL